MLATSDDETLKVTLDRILEYSHMIALSFQPIDNCGTDLLPEDLDGTVSGTNLQRNRGKKRK